ncbi:hypothetical protein BGW39_004063, partial [Mortierella sp. 14UC]
VYNFKDDQIQELKQHRQLILICEGYDESQQLVNLHYTNKLNQPGQWNTEMIISCRNQFLGPNYLDRFKPQSNDRYVSVSQDVFQEADQVKNYVEQYAQDPQAMLLFRDQTVWSAQEYMAKLTAITNVMDLVKNPFLLTLALKALPGLVASNKDLLSIRVTRVGLYDMFIDQWLQANRLRLQTNTLSQDELKALNSLVEDDFIGCGTDYLTRLAEAIFKEQNGNPIVQYIHSETTLLGDASPLMRTGNQYRFIHRSILEYFLSRAIYNPARIDEEDADLQDVSVTPTLQSLVANSPLFQRSLLGEPSIIQFLCDRQQLRNVVDLSKTDDSATIAAANAVTILVRAGVTFNGADLQGVKVPGADLSNG